MPLFDATGRLPLMFSHTIRSSCPESLIWCQMVVVFITSCPKMLHSVMVKCQLSSSEVGCTSHKPGLIPAP